MHTDSLTKRAARKRAIIAAVSPLRKLSQRQALSSRPIVRPKDEKAMNTKRLIHDQLHLRQQHIEKALSSLPSNPIQSNT